MSLRITHANPEGLELGTSEQQIVLAKDGDGAKKPTDFRPVVSTFKIKISWSCPLLSLAAGVCQVLVCFSRHFLLEQRGDTGTEGGDSLSLRAAPRHALPSGPHLTTCISFTSENPSFLPCPQRPGSIGTSSHQTISAVGFCPCGWTDRFLLYQEAAPGAAQHRELQNCCSVQAFGDQVLFLV